MRIISVDGFEQVNREEVYKETESKETTRKLENQRFLSGCRFIQNMVPSSLSHP